MRNVTHHFTSAGEDGTLHEVLYGYGPGQRRLLGGEQCGWRQQITWGGAKEKALGHLASTHGASGAPAMTRDGETPARMLWVMPACFAVAAALPVRLGLQG